MSPTPNPNAVSVVIRTFNSEKTLGRVFSGLKLAVDEEMITVDSGSTDSTLSIAAAHGARMIRAEGPFNYSRSLNLGFRAAQNPWVLVLSSHSISVVPDLLGVFRSAVRDFPDDVAVGYGPNTLDGRAPFSDDGIRYSTWQDFQTQPLSCGNGNTLYRRSAWEIVPFDETIRTGEDRAWLAEICRRGFRLAHVPAAKTINSTQYSLRYMFSKGYSDIRAGPHKAQSPIDLAMGLGSLARRFLRGEIPAGNWIRYSAHAGGRFFGSYQDQDNTPDKLA